MRTRTARTEITPAVSRLIWVQAAARCSFPDCRKELLVDASNGGDSSAVGEVAHIVSASPKGPRGNGVAPGGDRNGSPNLLLLCPTHHEIIDKQPQDYTVERLIGIKSSHETWVREIFRTEIQDQTPRPQLTETVHSTLLAVEHLPEYLYLAPTTLTEAAVKAALREPADPAVTLPFVVRGGMIITFTPLTDSAHPFTDAITPGASPQRCDSFGWWQDPDLSRWYVALLNRTLNKLTGRRGLSLDKDHNRYFFSPARDESGNPIERTVRYRPLNQAESEKNAVWRPKRRATGEAKSYWTHLAVGLRFLKVTSTQWVLAIRPERRFTVDGTTPLVPKAIGRRSTSLKSRMYNYEVLGEVQFWREFLSDGKPHIILDFGGQTLVVDSTLRSGTVEWPGVVGDVKPFENVQREDDLFTSAAHATAVDQVPTDADLEGWELEDFEALGDSEEDDL